MKSRIVIASNSKDRSIGKVLEELHRLKRRVVRYDADLAATGQTSFTISMNGANPIFTYDNQQIDPRDIGAAWYRRPTQFVIHNTPDRALRHSIDAERSAAQVLLWDNIPDLQWLNSPATMVRANHKLLQLQLAGELGFNVPKTVVSNQWDDVLSGLPKGMMIYKSFTSSITTHKDRHLVFTTQLLNDKKTPPVQAFPYPGIWQENIEKKYEWRITVVGKEIFAVRIRTEDTAKDDWRKHQLTDKVKFEKGRFPKKESDLCLKMLEYLDLRYGAFDFAETPEGDIVFFEVNPNGQFGWLEDQLGLPISAAIARELVSIADERS